MKKVSFGTPEKCVPSVFCKIIDYTESDIKYDYENIPSYHPEDLKEYLNIFKENNINAFF